ncbi:MAG TPA: chorismate mutase [Acidimicrobiales bacterium]|jgi:chorismate mutase|nr:chorismate mutase [Acidimicrobiales bacterium]
MPITVRSIRGATTVDEDTPAAITERVVALLERVLERNGLVEDDIISILFTATEDVVSTFPATAARSMGLGAVPLICARELAITGSVPRCIRVMLHVNTERGRDQIHHVYLEGAQGLRDDLPD